MIGAREEALGKTRSETKELSSPTTCLISAVTSGPTEPKTFQEACHYQIEKERDNWRAAIRKEIRSMIEK